MGDAKAAAVLEAAAAENEGGYTMTAVFNADAPRAIAALEAMTPPFAANVLEASKTALRIE